MLEMTAIEDLFEKHQWLINDPNHVEKDVLMGIVESNPDLVLLDTTCIIRKDYNEMTTVKILSGGPSGHEPSYAGFVGRGMLTASVQGPLFSSPSPDKILKTIKELSRNNLGLLVITDGRTSNKLNFGVAIERARNVHVKSICVRKEASKCSMMCSAILIQKIAGAMSELGFFLSEIHEYCNLLVNDILSVVFSIKNQEKLNLRISSCMQKLPPKTMDFGTDLLGNRGETIALLSAHDTAKVVISKFIMESTFELDDNFPVVMLINNLGNISKMEEYIFLKEIISELRSLKIIISRIYCGRFMTAVSMAGFSVTIMKIRDQKTLDYLDAPCDVSAWKTLTNVILDPNRDICLKYSVEDESFKNSQGPCFTDSDAKMMKIVLTFACNALISCERQLNVLDSKFGDADTGTNIKKLASIILLKLSNKKLLYQWPLTLFEQLSKLSENCMEGIGGTLYSLMFQAAAKPFANITESDKITPYTWLESIKETCRVLKRYGNVNLGDGTMYDAVHACMESFEYSLNINESWISALETAVIATEKAAIGTQRTGNPLPDPGAHAVGIWIRALYEAVKYKNVN